MYDLNAILILACSSTLAQAQEASEAPSDPVPYAPLMFIPQNPATTYSLNLRCSSASDAFEKVRNGRLRSALCMIILDSSHGKIKFSKKNVIALMTKS